LLQTFISDQIALNSGKIGRMKYGFIEVELKPTLKVLARLRRLGIRLEGMPNPKIVYITKELYNEEEHLALCKQGPKALQIHGWNAEDIKKIRTTSSAKLLGNSEDEANLLKDNRLLQNSSRIVYAQNKPAQNHCIYLLRLAETAFETGKMRNPNLGIPRSEFPIYVGQTGNSREHRFQQHVNPGDFGAHINSSFYTKHPYSDQFTIADLTDTFRDKIGQIDNLTASQAKSKEREVTELLRNKYGYWTYSA
jgi:hypothetical protein